MSEAAVCLQQWEPLFPAAPTLVSAAVPSLVCQSLTVSKSSQGVLPGGMVGGLAGTFYCLVASRSPGRSSSVV